MTIASIVQDLADLLLPLLPLLDLAPDLRDWIALKIVISLIPSPSFLLLSSLLSTSFLGLFSPFVLFIS